MMPRKDWCAHNQVGLVLRHSETPPGDAVNVWGQALMGSRSIRQVKKGVLFVAQPLFIYAVPGDAKRSCTSQSP
jgi:hypothetical protein